MRLVNAGREDLLPRVESGEIELYEAMIIAGLCEVNSGESVAAMTNRWNRLSKKEKREFTSSNLAELVQLVTDLETV